MNVFNKVTLQSLKKNKTRTIVTIIGIILSAAMICAVTTFVSSMREYALRGAIYTDGDWHGSELNTEFDTYTEIWGTGKASNATALQQFGYAKLEESKNEYKPYIYLLGADHKTEEMLPVHITSGKFPTLSNEILLPEHLLSNGGTNFKIGDTITLDLGERTLDGFPMYQNNPCYTTSNGEEIMNDEKIEVRESRTYTVVGFYERFSMTLEDYSAPGYTALTVMDKEINTPYQFSVFFKMEKPAEVYDFMKELELTGQRNTDVLMYSGVSQYDGFSAMLYSMAAIVIGLIMFGSISLIYNAFAISVSERTKQFGLLSSVGATKKQLRKMVFFEALAVSVVGIPLGVLSGIGGIGITLMAIGDKFTSLGFPIDMELSVSWLSVVAAVVVSLVTVLISAWIPSKKATKISAVEAIRQNADIKAKEKNVRTSKLTYKLFGLPGVLANKHYKRSKKKYRTTIISLFMSIVLFVSASAFGDYLMESVEGGFGNYNFDLSFTAHYAEDDEDKISPEELLQMTSDDKAIKESVYTQEYDVSTKVDPKYLTDEILETIYIHEASGELVSDDKSKANMADIHAPICFINDAEFRRLLKQYGLSESEFFNAENPKGIVLDEPTVFDREVGKYVTKDYLKSDNCVFECITQKEFDGYHYFSSEVKDGKRIYKFKNNDKEEYITMPEEEALVKYTLETAKTITDQPFYIGTEGSVNLLYPVSMRDIVLPKDVVQNFAQSYKFYFTSSEHKVSEEALKQTLSENGFSSKNVFNQVESKESERNLVTIIQVFSYGFIVLISLIAAANVFNTISTNISLRRREFAMLKTVGMTKKGFNRMMNFECILYGTRSLLLGLPVSAGVTYLIYLSVGQGYETTYRLPIVAMGIATLSVFLVVFATMMYSMSKIRKDNPIDALKNENL